MGFLSMEEADARRWQVAFATCVDCGFGALFKVDEDLWIESLGDTYVNRARTNHPGCSLRKHNATLGPIPLLHGTSKKPLNPCIEVVPVQDVYGNPYTTWFGGLDPVPMAFAELWRSKRIVAAEKPRLDAEETVAMLGLCARRGW